VKPGEPSATARRVAVQRLGFERVEAPDGDPAADDALARDVAGEDDGRRPLARYLEGRTRFFDRVVVGALDAGIDQVVVAAAGYDGRALRYAKPGVAWFEVDHPDTQADKVARLQRLGLDHGHIHFVPVDFTVARVADALPAAGLRTDRPALVLLEGVVVYLDVATAADLFAQLGAATGPGSRLAVSLSLPGSDDPEREERRRAFEAGVAALGETTRSHLTPAEAEPLLANAGMSYMGVTLCGQGFVVDPGDSLYGLESPHLRPYLVGNELNRRLLNRKVIDFFGLQMSDARRQEPELFDRVITAVKPERDRNNRQQYRKLWWLYCESRPAMRRSLQGLQRYIATGDVSKHRTFHFVPGAALLSNTCYAFPFDDAYFLGVLSSWIHVVWSLAAGGTLEDRPRYFNDRCFQPFPFPDATDAQKARIRQLGEDVDAFRKARQAKHPELTITGMYNVLEKLHRGEALTKAEEAIRSDGAVGALKSLHDDLDRAVCAAYGWPETLLARTPETDAEIVRRVVALNRERRREETTPGPDGRPLIRWLRPDFQQSLTG